MLIGLTALVMMLFFGGGQETYFLNPDIQKSVKTYVADKHRKSEIKNLIKEIEKDQKSFLKKRNKYYNKKASELNLDYHAKRSDFDKLFSEYFEDRQKMMNSYWDKESKIRSLFVEAEWNQMIEQVLEKPDKEKARKGFTKASEKIFGDLAAVCKKQITKASGQEAALQAVKVQQETVNRIIDEYLNQNYKHLELLRNLTATKDDFEQATKSLNQLRKEILKGVSDMRFEIIANTTEAEWKRVAKEIDKLFTGGKNIV
jgi:hypothetical protein